MPMDSSDGSQFFQTCEGGATYPVRYTYDVYGNKTTMTTYRHEPDGGGVGLRSSHFMFTPVNTGPRPHKLTPSNWL